MFTGIIEAVGKVVGIAGEGRNVHFVIESPISDELSVDQSVSHNGVCLTVTQTVGDTHQVTAVSETLDKSNLGDVQLDDLINLERSMLANGRFDGHIVQGHVDARGKCLDIQDKDGSWLMTFSFPSEAQSLIVEKGSITINGISLTCFDVEAAQFKVAIIPYTFEHTNFQQLAPGDAVNLEYDILGKYVKKMLAARDLKVD